MKHAPRYRVVMLNRCFALDGAATPIIRVIVNEAIKVIQLESRRICPSSPTGEHISLSLVASLSFLTEVLSSHSGSRVRELRHEGCDPWFCLPFLGSDLYFVCAVRCC